MNQSARDENALSARLAQAKREEETLAALKRIEALLKRLLERAEASDPRGA